VRVVRRLEHLRITFRIIRDHDFERPRHAHDARHAHVQIVPDRVLEGLKLRARRFSRHADRLAEVTQRFRRDASAPHPGDRRHPRIVPTGDESFVHEAKKLSFAQHRVVELEARELRLLGRALEATFVHEPTIDVVVVLELERAQRVRDAFDRVG